MAKFNGYVLTEKGRELLAKGLAGGKIEFTKMQIGDGTSGADARSMIALVNPKKDLNLLNINASGGQCELTALLSNHELSVGFYIRELGVFARGDDNTEILYAYNVSTNPDFVPPFSANNIVEIEYVDTLIIDRAANVTAIIDPSITYITRQAADTLYLEKKRLAEIIGLEFGGNIQDSGQKMTGKFYYDNVTKHYFECIQNNTDTFTSTTNFRAISNKPISDKLENLFEIESYSIDSRLTVGLIQKIGNICILNLDSNEIYNGKNYGEVLFNIPERFRPKVLTPVSVGLINSVNGGAAHIETNGDVIWRGARTSSALYINAVYLS